VTEFVAALPDGRELKVYDDGALDGDLVAYWHHGGGMTGALPAPLVALAARSGIRLISHDRPGYGGSSPQPGRSAIDVVRDTEFVLDRLGVETFTTIGLSAGAVHAIACACVLGDRVSAVATIAAPAPLDAPGLDPFAGMAADNVDEFRAALRGRSALEQQLAAAPVFAPELCAPADLAAMNGAYWDWQIAAADSASVEGTVEDELAFVARWGFDPASVSAPWLLVHGTDDRFVPPSHARWLVAACPTSQLRLIPGAGHISVIPQCEAALLWLRENLD
jgi:pimeloyl-ACP methyl ester carboxylesterase